METENSQANGVGLKNPLRLFFPSLGDYIMKCAECVKEGERSTVNDLGGMVTCMYYQPYYDEEGEYHRHDSNLRTNTFRCSRGHSWSTSTVAPCPNLNCDWGKP